MKGYVLPLFLSNDERITLLPSSLTLRISRPLESVALQRLNLYLVFFQRAILALYLKLFCAVSFPSCTTKSFRNLALAPALITQLLLKASFPCPKDSKEIVSKSERIIICFFILIIYN